MKKLFAFLFSMIAVVGLAQTTNYGSLRDSMQVVTNELDALALAAIVVSTNGCVQTNDTRYLAALTNAAAFESAGSLASYSNAVSNAVALAKTALQINPTPAQIGAMSNTTVAIGAAGGVTNAGAFINGNAISNGANITLSGGTGTTFAEVSNVVRAIALTNFGATINGNAISNGAAITITGSGGPSYLETTNIAEAAVAGYSNCVSNAVALAKTALQSEADTLQTVITRGSTASGSISVGTEDGDNIRLGYSAGSSGATGNNNFYAAVGGYGAVGSYNFWGTFAGWTVRGGDYNSGIGFVAGQYSSASSVSYFGAYSGTSNNLSNAVFIDAYATDPCASGTSFTRPATNDSIVIDGNAAQMYLGRPDGSVQLRGNITGITAAQVGAVPTNRTITINGSVGTLDSNLVLTVEGGGGSGTSTGDAYRVIQADTGAYVFVSQTNAYLVSDGGVIITTNQAYSVVTNLIVVAGGTWQYGGAAVGTVYTPNGILNDARRWISSGEAFVCKYVYPGIDTAYVLDDQYGEYGNNFSNKTTGFATGAGTYVCYWADDASIGDTVILAEQLTTNLLQTTTNVFSYTNLLCTAPFASNIVNTAVANITAAVTLGTNLTVAGSLTVSNGAAMYGNTIVSGNFYLGPSIGGNRAFLSSNGTNLFFVTASGATTNQITSN